jgi:hypothetical protein
MNIKNVLSLLSASLNIFSISVILLGVLLYVTGGFKTVITTSVEEFDGEMKDVTRRNWRIMKGPIDLTLGSFVQAQRMERDPKRDE